MRPVMIPPPMPLPDAMRIPRQPLAMPQFDTPEWEPIPIYRNPTPEEVKTGTRNGEKEAQGESADKDKESRTPESNIPEPAEVDLPDLDVVIHEMNEVNTVTIPIIEVDVPLPKNELVVIAVTTASVSAVAAVGGTMIPTTLLR